MKITRSAACVALATLSLTACTSPEVQTTDPNQRTKEGVVAGALLGGVFGALTGSDAGERQRGAVIGAVAGSAIGAAVGYSLDQQAADLQAELANERIQIINNGDHLVVRMPDDILFDVDSAEVKPVLRTDLQSLAGNLQRYPDSTVQVIGHTDDTGSEAYNQDLSLRRAGAVSAVLIGAGVSAARINSVGLGETLPIASNETVGGRALNRRVDITIRPNA